MNKMLPLLGLYLILNSGAFAQAPENLKAEHFQKIKEMTLKHIDERISNLQEFKSCIQGTSDRDGMKKCRESNQQKMKNLGEMAKGEREAARGELKQKREEHKKKKE